MIVTRAASTQQDNALKIETSACVQYRNGRSEGRGRPPKAQSAVKLRVKLRVCRCTPVRRSKDAVPGWLPHGDLIGDEGETQRALALETATVLSHVTTAEERLMQAEMKCRSCAPDALYGHF